MGMMLPELIHTLQGDKLVYGYAFGSLMSVDGADSNCARGTTCR